MSDRRAYSLLACCLFALVMVIGVSIHYLSEHYCQARWAYSHFQTKYTFSGGCLVAKKGTESYMPERRVRMH